MHAEDIHVGIHISLAVTRARKWNLLFLSFFPFSVWLDSTREKERERLPLVWLALVIHLGGRDASSYDHGRRREQFFFPFWDYPSASFCFSFSWRTVDRAAAAMTADSLFETTSIPGHLAPTPQRLERLLSKQTLEELYEVEEQPFARWVQSLLLFASLPFFASSRLASFRLRVSRYIFVYYYFICSCLNPLSNEVRHASDSEPSTRRGRSSLSVSSLGRRSIVAPLIKIAYTLVPLSLFPLSFWFFFASVRSRISLDDWISRTSVQFQFERFISPADKHHAERFDYPFERRLAFLFSKLARISKTAARPLSSSRVALSNSHSQRRETEEYSRVKFSRWSSTLEWILTQVKLILKQLRNVTRNFVRYSISTLSQTILSRNLSEHSLRIGSSPFLRNTFREHLSNGQEPLLCFVCLACRNTLHWKRHWRLPVRSNTQGAQKRLKMGFKRETILEIRLGAKKGGRERKREPGFG